MSEGAPAATPAPAPAPRARARQLRASHRIAFALVSIAIVLGSLELGTRLLGLGDPERFGGSRLRYQQVFPPLFTPTGDGSAFRPRDPRLVDRAFPRARAGASTPLRVFVFGESAVAGLGYSENASFSRALERRLQARDAQARVINCGIVALASRQIARIVDDLASLREHEASPGRDVFVFHVGNNEFLELHAQRFAETAGGRPFAARVGDALEQLRFFAAVKQASIAARHKELSPRSFATEDLRLPESQLVKVVRVSEDERAQVIAGHVANLRRMIERTRRAGALPVLMTVAVNTEWGGKEDPPEGWLGAALGKPWSDDPAQRGAQLNEALARLDARLQTADEEPLERWKDLLCRAHVLAGLERWDEARAAYQQAKDADPRLRRCLTQMNENVRQLARELDVPLVDGERALEGSAPHGIVGFRDLYDYVHFTPDGAERIAAAIDAQLVGMNALAGPASPAEPPPPLATGPGGHDTLDVTRWVGWNDDPQLVGSRDLWKYEAARKALDELIEKGSPRPEQLVWAANGYALEVGGEARARELYARAQQAGGPEVQAAVERDLAWLDARPQR